SRPPRPLAPRTVGRAWRGLVPQQPRCPTPALPGSRAAKPQRPPGLGKPLPRTAKPHRPAGPGNPPPRSAKPHRPPGPGRPLPRMAGRGAGDVSTSCSPASGPSGGSRRRSVQLRTPRGATPIELARWPTTLPRPADPQAGSFPSSPARWRSTPPRSRPVPPTPRRPPAGPVPHCRRRPPGPEDPPGPAGPCRSEVERLLARDVALAEPERELSRQLKRVLADEQNEVFDRLRRADAASPVDLLPPRAAQVDRYARAGVGALDAAARLGADDVGGGSPGRCTKLATEMGDALVEPLRERVERILRESAGDLEEVTERLRALYREWKSQRINSLVRHYTAAAF